jgi:hypothetical protein
MEQFEINHTLLLLLLKDMLQHFWKLILPNNLLQITIATCYQQIANSTKCKEVDDE